GALPEAVGNGNGAKQARLICSDAPVSFEGAALRAAFPRLRCLAEGPLQIALKVEQASGEKPAQLSNVISRCVVKFSKGPGDGKPCFRGRRRRASLQSLGDDISSLLDAAAARRKSATQADGNPERPRRNAAAFVKDIAAARKMSPREMSEIAAQR
ncbi:unnamed protein product, partial [Prorocentrum cordatum]